jgi:membrane-bound lytic murein transglycosylase D
LTPGCRTPIQVSVILATALLLLASCSSTTPNPSSEFSPTVTANPAEPYREWEETTRIRADELMAEARQLQNEGRVEEAIARADEALCEVLQIPPDYLPGTAYIEFLAELVDEANDIEAALQQFDGEIVASEEFDIMPPIDIFVNEESVAEVAAEGPLPASDFPLILNPTVEQFLEAMVTPGEYNSRIAVGLVRAGEYLPMIRARFANAGLPQDLAYLPLIESAFSVKAYSRARAHGMWQFISSTGRHYGLEVGTLIDDRRDPELSTAAAIAYLSDLYDEFDDWYLALAAYNSGAGNVRRAIRRSGSSDFWILRDKLPRETRNYVPAFIASVIVAKNPAAYGFTAPQEKEWNFDSIEVPDALDLQFLATKSGIPLDDLRELNPAIRRDLTPGRSTTALRLPPGSAAAAEAALETTPRSQWAPRTIHTVRSGDSLYSIALRYGSNVIAIRQANGLSGSLIHPGQNLIVPRFGSDMAAVERSPTRETTSDGTYAVQRNDTLWDIARAFSMSVDQLCAANGMSRRDIIRPGQRLRIPTGDGPAPIPATAAVAPANRSTTTHEVRAGDTLYDLALRYGVTVTALKQANELSSPRIYPGKVLRIPPAAKERPSSPPQATTGPGMYRVQRGDTLYDIARRFGVSMSELSQINGLSSSRIYPGDVLRIPTSQAKS